MKKRKTKKVDKDTAMMLDTLIEDQRVKIISEVFDLMQRVGKTNDDHDYTAYIIVSTLGSIINTHAPEMFDDIVKQIKDNA